MTGVAAGTGMTDLIYVNDTAEAMKKGYNRMSPFYVPCILPSTATGQIIGYGF
jgi:3-oxoacyl-[acyl-carrier-protein] synthase II